MEKIGHVMKLSVLVLLLLLGGSASGHRSKSTSKIQSTTQQQDFSGEIPEDHEFFLKQIFDKYGHQGVISFEGFEHLLENLGLGRLVFEKSHALSLHKVNGSFQEVHDSLNLHHHSHSSNNGSQPIKRRKRQINAKDSVNNAGPKVTAYAEPKPVSWSSHCLTPQDLLLTFGLEPHHKAIISQRIFLEICPAIIYELDQRSCYTGTREQITTTEHKGVQASPSAVWLYSSLSVLVISLIGLLGVAIVPLVQRAFFQQILHFLVALAVGTMCGDALLHLLPHALVSDSDNTEHLVPVFRASVAFLAIFIFFLFERVLHNISHSSSEDSTGELSTQQTRTKERKPLNDLQVSEYGAFDGVSIVGGDGHIDDVGQGEYGDGGGEFYMTERCPPHQTKGMTSLEYVADFDTEADLRVQKKHQHGHQHGGHQHHGKEGESIASVAWIVIMGDGLHNLTDGLAIGAAFSGDIVAGFATAVAVLCHELPHELGDFAVLLQAGMSVRNAITYNIISSILSFIGMAIGVWLGEYEATSLWIYAFTAGSFLYISLVDLIPEMNNYSSQSSKGILDVLLQMAGITTGASIMLVIAIYEENLSTLFS